MSPSATGVVYRMSYLNSIRVLLIVLTSDQLKYSITDGKEYCHNEQFTAKCPDEELILVTSALYGRMRIGSCVKTDFGYVGCFNDVTQHVHERCSGRPSCAIRVPDATLDRTKPCNEDLKSYLDVNYTCIKVAGPAPGENCEQKSDREDFSGYLSDRVPSTASKSCGSRDFPWTIRVLPGQRINLTLLDFSSTLSRGSGSASSSCDLYAVVMETDGVSGTNICGTGSVQRSHVYTSTAHVLKVFLKPRKFNNTTNYVFKYEAVGCPDFQTPLNAWINGEGGREEITVGCLGSDDVWQVVCEGNRWEGALGNCSAVSSRDARREEGLSSLSLGASILTILGVSLTIGVVVLLVGLFYMRSKRIGNVIGQELAMRDLKPLNSATAVYDTTVVYARNKAFEPVKVNIVRSSGTAGKPGQERSGATDPTDYEYVWDCPSSLTVPRAAGQATAAVAGARVSYKPADDSPDLLKVTSAASTSSTTTTSTSSSSSSSPNSANNPRMGSSGQQPSLRSVTLPKKEMGRRFERQTGTLGRMKRDGAPPKKADVTPTQAVASPRQGLRSTLESVAESRTPCHTCTVDRKPGALVVSDDDPSRNFSSRGNAAEHGAKRAVPPLEAPPPIAVRQHRR